VCNTAWPSPERCDRLVARYSPSSILVMSI
jgi:hypothetical protein